jgi:putative membrane protein
VKRAAEFFSAEERARIEAAVQEAETRTSGEIVPMVVDESFDYPRAEIMGGGLFALAAAVTLSWAFGNASVWVFLPLFVLLYFPFKLLIRSTPALRLRLIPPAEIDAEVEEKALVSFLEHGLHRTRQETGILILISLFEHRVRILADRGISAVVEQREWDNIVTQITAGIHAGETAEALCDAIRRCGDLLQSRFPAGDDNRNELPNSILH